MISGSIVARGNISVTANVAPALMASLCGLPLTELSSVYHEQLTEALNALNLL